MWGIILYASLKTSALNSLILNNYRSWVFQAHCPCIFVYICVFDIWQTFYEGLEIDPDWPLWQKYCDGQTKFWLCWKVRIGWLQELLTKLIKCRGIVHEISKTAKKSKQFEMLNVKCHHFSLFSSDTHWYMARWLENCGLIKKYRSWANNRT